MVSEPYQSNPDSGDVKTSGRAESILAYLRSTQTSAAEGKHSTELASVSPEIELVFLDYQELMLVYETTSVKGISPAETKRFCDEVMFAVDKKPFRQSSTLRYLPSETGQESKGKEADNKALDHLAKAAPDCFQCVLFGSEVIQRLMGSNTDSSVYGQANSAGKSMLFVESIGSYLTQPLSKKVLWNALLKFLK